MSFDLLFALLTALVLGLRHAADPDHLVAVTALVAAQDGDLRGAARLGTFWGAGHSLALVGLGVPLIALRSQVPPWVEDGAESAIGVVILVLAARVLYRWRRDRRHDSAGDRGHDDQPRTARQAFAIGMLHGLAGTGAVVVLLIAALPGTAAALAALAVFAPMSVASMTLFTSTFAWVLSRPRLDPMYRSVVIPGIGAFGVLFGLWYAGIA